MKTKARKLTLADLRRKAEAMGYTVEDDHSTCELYVHAPDGMAWEDGSLSCLMAPYGRRGRADSDWRQSSLADLIERLDYYPPSALVGSQI